MGFVCFALASVAIGVPVWGYYDSPSGEYEMMFYIYNSLLIYTLHTGGYDYDRGYFGPFKVCKQLTYNREKCGNDVSKFRLSSK